MGQDSALPRGAVIDRLRVAGCVFAEDEADLLLAAAGDNAQLESLVAQRISGVPVEHLLGWAEFCGLRVSVGPGVFVPRRRSELLVAEAVRLLRPGDVVVDLCCGSGAIAMAVAAAVPGVEVHAADIDPTAVGWADSNLAPYGGHAHVGDLYDALPVDLAGRVDVVVANAPYVPSEAIVTMPTEARLHEPAAALDGGADGTVVQRGVVAGADRWLRPGGSVLVETGRDLAARTRALVEARGFRADVVTSDDLDATAVVGRHQTRGPS
jgi:release factor glutamine methyltransferase